MLLYYFADKNDLIAAALEAIGTRFAAALMETGGLGADRRPSSADLARILRAETMQPFFRLWLELVTRAARGDAFYAAVGGRMADGFVAWVAGLMSVGRAEAVRTIAMLDGFILLDMVGRGFLVDKALDPFVQEIRSELRSP